MYCTHHGYEFPALIENPAFHVRSLLKRDNDLSFVVINIIIFYEDKNKPL
jgi:hypothetical protein